MLFKFIWGNFGVVVGGSMSCYTHPTTTTAPKFDGHSFKSKWGGGGGGWYVMLYPPHHHHHPKVGQENVLSLQSQIEFRGGGGSGCGCL